MSRRQGVTVLDWKRLAIRGNGRRSGRRVLGIDGLRHCVRGSRAPAVWHGFLL